MLSNDVTSMKLAYFLVSDSRMVSYWYRIVDMEIENIKTLPSLPNNKQLTDWFGEEVWRGERTTEIAAYLIEKENEYTKQERGKRI